ncbi:MAG: UV-damage endonuclease [Phycisphaerales bacterium]|nr:UV-damage endonuclease [Phycisphaerales bacterium]
MDDPVPVSPAPAAVMAPPPTPRGRRSNSAAAPAAASESPVPGTPAPLALPPAMSAPAVSGSAGPHGPNLGLVCITAGPEVRYRTITRTRFLSFDEPAQVAALDALYRDNLRSLFGAIDYCADRGLRLYRVTSNLFPQIDHPVAKRVFETLAAEMAPFGDHARRRGVRVLVHPDQYVVLNSESDRVAANSAAIMADHALIFDRLNLARTPWACMILHGGKGGRADELVNLIPQLPDGVRSRLVLENDENAYGAEQILDVCRRAGVPMVFDHHHHAVQAKLASYDDPSVRHYVEAARATWPDPAWQLVHVSNGIASITDQRHSDLIHDFPAAYRDVPWVEVEAKGKEMAIDSLRLQFTLGR